jgi:II/X family phage/plasmid replication protein
MHACCLPLVLVGNCSVYCFLGMLSLWDKADLRIDFDDLFVNEIAPISGQRAGMVAIELYDFPAECPVAFIDGKKVYSDPKARKWGSISSAISTVAVGFFPEGNGFYPWPHVSIKASPNKILQGHNVFGTENIREGVYQMLALFKQAFPKIAQHLDFKSTEVRFLDSTYSAFIESEYQRNQIIRLFD